MIRKRYGVVLIVGLASIGLLTAWSAAVVMKGNPYRARLLQVRVGMPVEQAVHVMGCPPDDWWALDVTYLQDANLGELEVSSWPPVIRGGQSGWPPPTTTDRHFEIMWNHPDGSASRVVADPGGVTAARWKAPTESLWQRLRRWLHL